MKTKDITREFLSEMSKEELIDITLILRDLVLKGEELNNIKEEIIKLQKEKMENSDKIIKILKEGTS